MEPWWELATRGLVRGVVNPVTKTLSVQSMLNKQVVNNDECRNAFAVEM